MAELYSTRFTAHAVPRPLGEMMLTIHHDDSLYAWEEHIRSTPRGTHHMCLCDPLGHPVLE